MPDGCPLVAHVECAAFGSGEPPKSSLNNPTPSSEPFAHHFAARKLDTDFDIARPKKVISLLAVTSLPFFGMFPHRH
jgi:hypothetical protein